jgi:hypothetical protein
MTGIVAIAKKKQRNVAVGFMITSLKRTPQNAADCLCNWIHLNPRPPIAGGRRPLIGQMRQGNLIALWRAARQKTLFRDAIAFSNLHPERSHPVR